MTNLLSTVELVYKFKKGTKYFSVVINEYLYKRVSL